MVSPSSLLSRVTSLASLKASVWGKSKLGEMADLSKSRLQSRKRSLLARHLWEVGALSLSQASRDHCKGSYGGCLHFRLIKQD